MSRSKDMKILRHALQKQGFDVTPVKNGHYRVVAPCGRKCQISATPRDHRSVLNAVTRLKRIGFVPSKS